MWQCLSANKRNCITLTELGQKNYVNTKWGKGQSVNSTNVHLSLMPGLYIFIEVMGEKMDSQAVRDTNIVITQIVNFSYLWNFLCDNTPVWSLDHLSLLVHIPALVRSVPNIFIFKQQSRSSTMKVLQFLLVLCINTAFFQIRRPH